MIKRKRIYPVIISFAKNVFINFRVLYKLFFCPKNSVNEDLTTKLRADFFTPVA
jgi:hypothetical protein